MRNLREILRLSYSAGLSIRQISVGSRATQHMVTKNVGLQQRTLTYQTIA